MNAMQSDPDGCFPFGDGVRLLMRKSASMWWGADEISFGICLLRTRINTE